MKKKIAIIGGGKSGTGAAVLAATKGYDVFVSDYATITKENKQLLRNQNVVYEEKTHTATAILDAQEVIISPGISPSIDIIQKCKDKNISIISEIEFAFRYIQAPIIGVTGTNGKTTTTALVGHIFETSGYNVGVCGNIGDSLALDVATNKSRDLYVLELSSYQLDFTYTPKLNIAILLNITPDHLDRYKTFQQYINSKIHITQLLKTESTFIWNADDAHIVENISTKNQNFQSLEITLTDNKKKTAFVADNQFFIHHKNKTMQMYINELALQGKHNLYNSMAASVAARVMDLKKVNIRNALANFDNLPHRLEYVATVKGVDYINDSKATNLNSSWYALESMNKPVIWIAGGVDKGNDYNLLMPLVKQKVKAIVCLGKDNTKLKAAFSDMFPEIVEYQTMAEAVKQSYKLAEKGDVVLLSPACASFDLFKDYKIRGRTFVQSIREL